jgi:hypothetical protein
LAGKRSSRRAADAVSIEIEVAQLRDLDLKALRLRWQTVTGRAAPLHLPRHLLFAMLAYRIQADAFGDLDSVSLQLLKTAASSASDFSALIDRIDQRNQDLLPGAILTREWNGRAHRVMVVADGFAWEGQTYDSLSSVALAITGTKWNGPRFFGLRSATPAMVGPSRQERPDDERCQTKALCPLCHLYPGIDRCRA